MSRRDRGFPDGYVPPSASIKPVGKTRPPVTMGGVPVGVVDSYTETPAGGVEITLTITDSAALDTLRDRGARYSIGGYTEPCIELDELDVVTFRMRLAGIRAFIRHRVLRRPLPPLFPAVTCRRGGVRYNRTGETFDAAETRLRPQR